MAEDDILYNGRFLRLRQRNSWEYMERVNPGGAVIIIAVTAEDKLLFVEQFRIPVNANSIEMPAGLVGDDAGDEHETAICSAHRELLEETGYTAQHIEFIMCGPSSAGASNEMVTFVRASGLRKVAAGGGDSSEQIIVHEVPRTEAASWVAGKMALGFSIDPKVYAGLYFLERDTRGAPWH